MDSSMVFLDLPDFSNLCCVTLTLREEEEERRCEQIKTCRELVLLYSDVLASPAQESFTGVIVVMALKFFQMGVIQMFGTRHQLMLAPPQCVFPGVLQACLSFSVITRLSPRWNKVGLFLVSGKDFVSERGKMDAVRLEWNTSEGQLCINVEANTIRIPPPTLEEFDLPPLVLRKFWSDLNSVLEPPSAGIVWCHVLPSMKKGQIIRISHKLPQDGPFRTYGDLQKHWKSLYGYSLPDLPEKELVYCSVYFRLVGERLFTYPLSCIRLQQVQRCPRREQRGLLSSFLSDISTRLQNVCGFPTCLSRKRSYCTGPIYTTVQVLSDGINPATTSFSSSPLLQFPNVPHQLPTMPYFRSQHSTLPSQQDRAQGLLGNEYGFRPCLSQGSVSSVTSSSPLVPASSHVPSSKQISPPKLVPIFKKRHPSRQVSSALLRLRKREMLTGTTHNLFSAQPGHSRLWVPPAPKFRCDLKTTLKQSSEREVKENISEHQTSGSSTQITFAGADVERRTRSGEPPLPRLVS